MGLPAGALLAEAAGIERGSRAVTARNGGVRVTKAEARAIGLRLHERAVTNRRNRDGDQIWPAWVEALSACGLDVQIVRKPEAAAS